jgi:Nucleotidyltransferase domain
MEHIVSRLAEIPGVVAVTLGGSRARGEARPDSDWDFGLYYRGWIDPADVRALGWPGEVTAPGGWGPVVNGGAWLTAEGQRVDLCYRDVVEVEAAVDQATAGQFRIEALATFVVGIPTYVLVGELALGKVLWGSLPRPTFPEALRQSAPPRWRQLAVMALRTARAHASRGDVTATMGCLGQAVIAEGQARLAERRQWALNEKGVVQRVGLEATWGVLSGVGSTPDQLARAVERVAELLGGDPAPAP